MGIFLLPGTRFGLVWFLCFKGISSFMGYLMPKPSLLTNSSDTIKPIAGGEKAVHTFPKGMPEQGLALTSIT